MTQDFFQQRKKALLTKEDKSSIGGWDKKIKKLCNKINKKKNYYTTSSCSGRVLIMIDKTQKDRNLFLWNSHKKISLKEVKKAIEKISTKDLVKFKQEPFILHVACESLKDAEKLLKISQKVGIKKVGLISSGKRFIFEFNGSEKLEFPLMKNKELLVNEEFLKIVVEKSNNNLEKSWDKLKKLEKEF